MQQTHITSQTLKNRVLNLQTNDFDGLALDIFRFQAQHIEVYRAYLQHLGIEPGSIQTVEKIPFLPISFFKTQQVLLNGLDAQTVFESSGTTAHHTSKHHVADVDFYLQMSQQIFERFYGPLSGFHVLALLPSYLERNNASLVRMVQHFIENTHSEYSGFFLYDTDSLIDTLRKLSHQPKNILLIGVTFALLDLAESGYDFSFLHNFQELILMETGGMKGRRKELLRQEAHRILKNTFGVSHVHSEYGMTELLSQGYSLGDGIFEVPPSMKIILRDVNDPFQMLSAQTGKTRGGINVIDLANVDSCSFIETQDLGAFGVKEGTFEVLGRFDNSDIRGCNLMIL